jgi:hypothetical protein
MAWTGVEANEGDGTRCTRIVPRVHKQEEMFKKTIAEHEKYWLESTGIPGGSQKWIKIQILLRPHDSDGSLATLAEENHSLRKQSKVECMKDASEFDEVITLAV